MLGKNVQVSLLFLLFTINFINCLVVCQQNACDIVKCKAPEECTGPNQDLRKGGYCNCCTVCYTTLEENEKCPTFVTIGGPPPTIGCGEGLKCIGGKCKKPKAPSD
ncbi:fungal protease inhibitor-1-like [Coccinella septempunctata]|uniref:fungal protease inhibitor-1-like n=1 Tax=Coccinella septempunctata TaxID=41139 RepID=UPI001D092769|nr:fungal protease inhibitor-1-like [Coccinella septempunctata]